MSLGQREPTVGSLLANSLELYRGNAAPLLLAGAIPQLILFAVFQAAAVHHEFLYEPVGFKGEGLTLMLLLLPVVALATSTAFACTTSYVHEWQDRSGPAPRARFGKNFWKLWSRALNVALSVLVRAFGFFVLLYILLLLAAALLGVGDQGLRLVGVICWLAAALFLSRHLLTVPILSYEGARPKPAIQLSLTLCRQHWRVAAQVTLVMLLVAVAPGVAFHGPTSLIMALIDPTSSRLDPWSDGLIALVGGAAQIAAGPVWTSLPALLYSGLKSLEAGGAPPPAPGPFRRA